MKTLTGNELIPVNRTPPTFSMRVLPRFLLKLGVFLFKAEAFLFYEIPQGKFYGIAPLLLLVLGIVLEDHANAVIFAVSKGPFPGNNDMKDISPPLSGFAESFLKPLKELIVKVLRRIGILELDPHDLPRPGARSVPDETALEPLHLLDLHLLKVPHVSDWQGGIHLYHLRIIGDVPAQGKSRHLLWGLGQTYAMGKEKHHIHP